MSEKKLNWAYFWELLFAYPKFLVAVFVLMGLFNFSIGYFNSGMTALDATLFTIGGLIMVIPFKPWILGIYRGFKQNKDFNPFGFFLRFIVWRMFIFLFIAGFFVFPVMTKYVDVDAQYSQQEKP